MILNGMKQSKKFFMLVALCFLVLPFAAGAAVKVGFVSNNIWLSAEYPLAGDNIKIYCVIVNSDEKNVEGNILFYDNDSIIGLPVSFSLAAGGTSRVISVDWNATAGNHQFKAVIVNAVSVDAAGGRIPASGNVTSQTEVIFVDVDSDGDGLPNQSEASAGTNPNNPDTDGDGENDGSDPSPINSRIFNGQDTDYDGISDKVDTDIDNDGLYNWEEEKLGTDPVKYDTDGDGVGDKEDAYPLDKKRWEEEKIDVKPSAAELTPAVSGVISEPIEISESSESADNKPDGTVLGEKVYSPEDAAPKESGDYEGKNFSAARDAARGLNAERVVKPLIVLAIILMLAAAILLILSRKNNIKSDKK